MEYCIITYHQADDNMFETCIATLRKHSDCKIVVITDDIPQKLREVLARKYNIKWVSVPSNLMQGRRAACKVIETNKYCLDLPIDSQVLVSDADIYFMKDPFTVFKKHPSFDLGLTKRHYNYRHPINGGIYYYRITTATKRFLVYWNDQTEKISWHLFLEYIKSYGHKGRIPDWCIGQDFLNVLWKNLEKRPAACNINIIDVGWEYNFCIHQYTDRFIKQAYKQYKKDLVTAIHLKGGTKKLLYRDDIFHDAIICHKIKYRDWGRKK